MANGARSPAAQGSRGHVGISLVGGCAAQSGTPNNGALHRAAARDDHGMGGGLAALRSLQGRSTEVGIAQEPLVVRAGVQLGPGGYDFGSWE